ncbi:MAG: hypothetical protein M1821_003388 [Bathelium mastoideum]|nr:MAG: hypothetical protein M1821_003388 [Bathelium mastoideum]KAI9686056.1 MAG: hypothetical protein M1822_004039 [Bathelium mastoideum]
MTPATDEPELGVQEMPGDLLTELEIESQGETEGEEVEENFESLKLAALDLANQISRELYGPGTVLELDFLARGTFNYVWLAKCHINGSETTTEAGVERNFVLRIPQDTPSLQPYQLRHEVACLQFISEKLPRIPAPKVYAWNGGSSDASHAFIAEEFIPGQRLSEAWPQLTEHEKSTVCWEIANVVADLGETRFELIGGFATHSTEGPTIELVKIFNGRAKFHLPHCYDIGPYRSSKDYILSCYDREIYYYTHANEDDIIAEAFQHTSVADFVEKLKIERQALADDDSVCRGIDVEPRVLVHEDFHARNILVRDGHLAGILDWEFSGAYPLSELLGPIAVFQISLPGEDRYPEEEELRWEARYRHDVEAVVRQRGWTSDDIMVIMGNRHPILEKARRVMFPDFMDTEAAADCET